MQDEANPGQDREARILARRKRIEEQLGAKAGDGGEQGRRKKEEAAAEESRSKVQISETRGKIDKIKTAGHAEVTTIRIVGDSRENERRINEEVNRQGRRQKLLHEAESSARQNAAVAMKWSALFEREIPQDLMQDIEQQKDTCERIIQSKDRLIKEFKTELKAKDDEYVKSLKKQAEDVDLLLDKMGQQYRSLRGAFEVELVRCGRLGRAHRTRRRRLPPSLVHLPLVSLLSFAEHWEQSGRGFAETTRRFWAQIGGRLLASERLAQRGDGSPSVTLRRSPSESGRFRRRRCAPWCSTDCSSMLVVDASSDVAGRGQTARSLSACGLAPFHPCAIGGVWG